MGLLFSKAVLFCGLFMSFFSFWHNFVSHGENYSGMIFILRSMYAKSQLDFKNSWRTYIYNYIFMLYYASCVGIFGIIMTFPSWCNMWLSDRLVQILFFKIFIQIIMTFNHYLRILKIHVVEQSTLISTV